MKKLIAMTVSGALLALFSLSGVANAQASVSLGAYGSAGGSATGVDVHTNANTSAGVNTGTKANDGASNSNSATASGDANAAADSGASFSLTQKDAASASIDAQSAQLDSSAVITSNDLSDFTTSRMKRDTNIEDVHAASDHVSLEYKKKAHFLGFIPASINALAKVSNDGSVTVSYPWYRFLFSVDGSSNAKSDLEARVQRIMASADLHAGFTAQVEAELIEAMHMALQGSTSAGTNGANAGTTADMAGNGADSSVNASSTGSANAYPN